MLFISCENKSNNYVENQSKEVLLKKAVVYDVDGNIIPIYTNLANATMEMLATCDSMEAAYIAGHTTEMEAQQQILKQNWKDARQYWELSESFLFGPVKYYDIDPHIDSWPLDQDKLVSLLNRIAGGEEVGIEDLTPGTTGFHALEYMLFNSSPIDGQLRNVSFYDAKKMSYMCLVAQDVASQTAMLLACWVGIDQIPQAQQDLLEELELEKDEFTDPYRYALTTLNSSKFKTYQSGASEIISGCMNIADEVGTKKMGRPHNGATTEDRNYIESPYALNSIKDFQDNIRSIKNSYEGVNGAYSISEYVQSRNASLDAEVRQAIDDLITAIGQVPEPFAEHATGNETGAAIDKATALYDKLQEVNALINAIE